MGVVSPPEAVAAAAAAKSVATATVLTYRSRPAAVFVKPYAVDHFNYWCDRLAGGMIDEETHGEIILEMVRRRQGMTSAWESVEIERTGAAEGYLVEVRVTQTGDTWWISEDDILRVAMT